MIDNQAIERLQQSAAIQQANQAVNQITANGVVALPDSFGTHDLEQFMNFRRRARGSMTTRDVQSFDQYVTKHAEEGAAIFIDAPAMSANAILNLGTPGEPGHADNKAVLALKPTAAYTALITHASGRGLTQATAAEFLEDWSTMIDCFNDAGEIAVSKAIAAVRKLTIEAMRKLESSEQSLSASKSAFESISATSKDPIPTAIKFTCEPYHGLPSRGFTMRLGIQTGSDKPSIVLRIINQEQHNEEMAQQFSDLVESSITSDLPVMIGTYSSK